MAKGGARGICTVDGCGMKHRALGFCLMHYTRFRDHGEPGAAARKRKMQDRHSASARICGVAGCANPHAARGVCRMHYYRLRTYGETGAAARLKAPRGSNVTGDYLLKATASGGTVLAHRIVMEETLGRPLRPGENVHHRNGIKTDNRPENLELWTRRQPSGQRVDDKIAWCIDFLTQYAPHVLCDVEESW